MLVEAELKVEDDRDRGSSVVLIATSTLSLSPPDRSIGATSLLTAADANSVSGDREQRPMPDLHILEGG